MSTYGQTVQRLIQSNYTHDRPKRRARPRWSRADEALMKAAVGLPPDAELIISITADRGTP